MRARGAEAGGPGAGPHTPRGPFGRRRACKVDLGDRHALRDLPPGGCGTLHLRGRPRGCRLRAGLLRRFPGLKGLVVGDWTAGESCTFALDEGLFDDAPDLEAVHLMHFAGLPRLLPGTPVRRLWLRGMRGPAAWGADYLAGLTRTLKELTVAESPSLAQFPAGSFAGVGALEHLELDRLPQLRRLPGRLCEAMGRLTRLDLNHLGVTALDPGWLEGCGRLAELELSRSRLTALPAGAFRGGETLATLHLVGNEGLADVGAEAFAGLSRLRELWLLENRVSETHGAWFRDTKQLEDLRLDRNSITALAPGLFDGLGLLRRLQLEGQAPPLADIPDDLFRGDFTRLTSLRLMRNAITSLPRDFLYNLPALTKLDLCHNPSFALPDGFFAQTPGLLGLYLYNTSVSEVTADAFRFPHLRTLRLEHSRVRRLGPRAFAGMPRLASIRLEGNAITEIAEGAFEGLEALSALQLQGNHLTSMPSWERSGLGPSLRRISLRQRAAGADGRECLVWPDFVGPFVHDGGVEEVSGWGRRRADGGCEEWGALPGPPAAPAGVTYVSAPRPGAAWAAEASGKTRAGTGVVVVTVVASAAFARWFQRRRNCTKEEDFLPLMSMGCG